MSSRDVIDRLEAVIDGRRRERPDGSYVVRLLDGGEPALGAKIDEEAAELVAAAGDRAATTHEAADLLFHMLVLLRARDVSFGEVAAELERRFGIGGLAEKAARSGATSG